MPDSRLPPDERAVQIISAGVAKRSGSVVEGPAEEMADAIMAFLAEHGFLDRSA